MGIIDFSALVAPSIDVAEKSTFISLKNNTIPEKIDLNLNTIVPKNFKNPMKKHNSFYSSSN